MNDHPSGKDRTAEPGTSNTQGKSTSDPDGEANGGPDKPGGDGGFDADKDGNNGCGNDDDFEDDNNGNCGGRRVAGANAQNQKQHQKQKQGEGAEVQGGDVRKLQGNVTEHKADVVEADGARSIQGAPTAAVQAVEDTRVLGVSLVREPATAPAVSGVAAAGRSAQAAPAVLAATGAPAVELAAIALLLIVSGAALVTGARRRELNLA